MSLSIILLTGCSGTRKLSKGQRLLVKNKLELKGKETNLSKSDLLSLTVQDPNESFLGLRIRLGVYNWAKDSNNNWWNRKLRELGEPPVILDSQAITKTLNRMKYDLASQGYFDPLISYKVKKKGLFFRKKKAKVIYIIRPNEPYRYRNITKDIQDDSIAALMTQWKEKTLLKKGAVYNVSTLEKERERITRQLQDIGYYAFSKEYISYAIDSSLGDFQMDVTLILRGVRDAQSDSNGNPRYLPHKKYYINDVNFIYESNRIPSGKGADSTHAEIINTLTKKQIREGDTLLPYYIKYQDKLDINPQILTQKTFVIPSEPFSLKNMEQSYSNLSDLRLFGYTNIVYQELPYDTTIPYMENNKLNCNISLIQAPKYNFSTQAEFTTSSGIQGIAANISFQDKNIFKGGEIFSLRLGGAFDIQSAVVGDKNNVWLNTFEAKIEAGLEIPRFLAPMSVDRFSKYFRPKTLLALGYSYQYKKDYQRTIVNASMSYIWKDGKSTHIFSPIEANSVKMYASSEFKKTIDTMSLINKRLKYQYEDHFILNSHYTYVYNGQDLRKQRGFNYVRFDMEAAGNLLYLGFKAFNAKKNADQQYELFTIPFAQYLRTVIDYKHHFVFAEDVALVLRSMIGVGFYYLNSKSLPYEKSFYGGGSNNIRAWRLYQLGPGSYDSPNKSIEQLGDINLVLNAEQRFPIFGGLKGAFFIDAGNIWLLRKNPEMPGAAFQFNTFLNDIAIGGGFGLRYDFGFFLIRLDAALPFRNPAKPNGQKWVLPKSQWSDILLNFGIGYPF